MPITEELKNLKKFESVGFSHEQSEALAETIEHAQASGYENLKEFIRAELDTKITGLDNKLDNKINGLRSEIKDVRNELEKQTKDFDLKLGSLDNRLSKQISGLAVSMAASQKDLLIKLFGIIVGTVGMAVTILKLFP